ncbi:hypothetical protein BG006_006821 [Podila minutissima]|uniref:Uncharacterized protein n=1 Tax=Podila minutissima TaxID=64525 RepID=A0A9P5VL64_9FUNG|nr:hypothetical protein BG006_006821 [Podila minutissima]
MDLEVQKKECKTQIEELVEHLKENHYLLGRASTTTLDSKVFHELVKNNVYVRDISASAINVEKFYLANKGKLDGLEKFVEEDAPVPVNTSSNTADAGGDVALDLKIGNMLQNLSQRSTPSQWSLVACQ